MCFLHLIMKVSLLGLNAMNKQEKTISSEGQTKKKGWLHKFRGSSEPASSEGNI